MNQLDFSTAPESFFVWKHPQSVFSAPHTLTIPSGMEALVIRDGVISDPYRPGDTLEVGARSGLFRKARTAREEVYICRKEMPFTLKWGLGGIPVSGDSTGTAFGANGTLRLSIVSLRQCIRGAAAGQHLPDEKAVGKWAEPILAGCLRPALAKGVQAVGLRAAAARPDILCSKAVDALNDALREAGLKVMRLTIDMLITH